MTPTFLTLEQVQAAHSVADQGWSFLQDPRILFLLAIYAVGMGLKTIPERYFRTRLIPATLTILGPFLGIMIFPELGAKKAGLVGLGFTAVAVYLNQILMQTFPNNKIVQIIAGEFNFSKNDCSVPQAETSQIKIP